MKIKNYKISGEKCTRTTSAGTPCRGGAVPKIFQENSNNNWEECRNSCSKNEDCEYFRWKVKLKIKLI